MRDFCNRFASLDDVRRLAPGVACLIAEKPRSGGLKRGDFGGFAAIRIAADGAALILS